MEITTRLQTPADYGTVELLTRDAFWGAMDHPACDGEHLLVHKLRHSPAFVPELDFVAEADGRLAGHILYTRAKVVTPGGQEIPVLTFGPLSVLPAFQYRGVGSALMERSIARAKELGYRAILLYGHPDYYPRFGFWRASSYGITAPGGDTFDALMAMPLYDGALDGVSGYFEEDPAFQTDPAEAAAFEATLPPKPPAELLPIGVLTFLLPETEEIFRRQQVFWIGSLHRFSGEEMLRWPGMDEALLRRVNLALEYLGFPQKLFPDSPVIQLARMGLRLPDFSLIREKGGVSLYRVEAEKKRYVLKILSQPQDRREIANYRLLNRLGVPTLPLLRATDRAILLPDLETDPAFRLGRAEDLSSPDTAKALARWYKALHRAGAALPRKDLPGYDESDEITPENMAAVAEKTGTQDNPLWAALEEGFPALRRAIDALPRTLTYNDFYWTNLAVSRDGSGALMFDYNLLGKGLAWGDLRNVTCALSPEAAAAFLAEYHPKGMEAQAAADAVIAPLVTLHAACAQDAFPEWAAGSLAELKSGKILESLEEFLKG